MGIKTDTGAVDMSGVVKKSPVSKDIGASDTGVSISLLDVLTIKAVFSSQAKQIQELRKCLQDHGIME